MELDQAVKDTNKRYLVRYFKLLAFFSLMLIAIDIAIYAIYLSSMKTDNYLWGTNAIALLPFTINSFVADKFKDDVSSEFLYSMGLSSKGFSLFLILLGVVLQFMLLFSRLV